MPHAPHFRVAKPHGFLAGPARGGSGPSPWLLGRKMLFDGELGFGHKQSGRFLGHHARSSLDHGQAEVRPRDTAPEPAAALHGPATILVRGYAVFPHCSVELHASVYHREQDCQVLLPILFR